MKLHAICFAVLFLLVTPVVAQQRCSSDADCGAYECTAGRCATSCDSDTDDGCNTAAGCSVDGTCMICTDSDYGSVTSEAGETEGVWETTSEIVAGADFCATDTELYEYFCTPLIEGYRDNTRAFYSLEVCPQGCLNGECRCATIEDCDDGYFCQEDGTCGLSECGDGQDNDDDIDAHEGGIDYSGACDLEAVVTPLSRGGYTSCLELGAGTADSCEAACAEAGGAYIERDPGCVSSQHNDERGLVAKKAEPEYRLTSVLTDYIFSQSAVAKKQTRFITPVTIRRTPEDAHPSGSFWRWLTHAY